jgi:signal transduction histidine kinase
MRMIWAKGPESLLGTVTVAEQGHARPRSRLLRHFLLAAAITVLCSMALLAYAVSYSLQSSLTLTAAEEGAALLDLFLGPSVQELATAKPLSEESSKKLDELLRTKLGERTKSLDIWLRDGTLVYSTDNKHLIGKKFSPPQVDATFLGNATATFVNGADRRLQPPQRPLIEIYAPLYSTDRTEIIAASRVHNNGERIAAELRTIRIASVAIVATVTAPMMFVLFLLVRRAVATVRRHRDALEDMVTGSRALAAQNDKLRQEADDARMESIQSNERFLAQIGQDLHDGPIQLLSILSLKLSDLLEIKSPQLLPTKQRSGSNAGDLLRDSLTDLRDIATGLVLPQLDGLSTEETLRLVVQQHESQTGTTVACKIDPLPPCPSPLKICLYRVVQEALNNAYHHANGNGQCVVASLNDNSIMVAVSDRGSGSLKSHPTRPPGGKVGLGLPGIRRRVEAFHGSLDVISLTDGTRIVARIPIIAASN